MTEILKFIRNLWEYLNKIKPETRSLIIILLFGYVLYSQINQSTNNLLNERAQKTIYQEKKAEEYAKNTAVEVNKHVRLIAHKDEEAFNVLLLSYHNSKQSLQGYRYLYLSCLTEAPKSVDYPLVKQDWSNLDYIYYADELEKLHNQSFIQIKNVETMKYNLPKLYRLVKSSDAKAVTFFVIEGKNQPIGIIVLLYKESPNYDIDYQKVILPSIQKLAIILDYENLNK